MQFTTQLRAGLGFRAAVTAIVAAFSMAGCAQPDGSAGQKLADNSGNNVGCQAFESAFWDELDRIPLEDKLYPSAEAMQEQFDRALSQGRLAKLSDSDRRRVADALTDLYRTLTVDAVRKMRIDVTKKEDVLALVTSVELGDRTTPEKSEIQDDVRAKFQAIKSVVASVSTEDLPNCTPGGEPAPSKGTPTPTPAPGGGTPAPGATPAPTATPAPPPTQNSQFDDWKATRHPAVYGGLKTFATAYQSCAVGQSAAIDINTPNVEGIKIVGTAGDGVGSLREIADLQALLRSHPYLNNWQKPKSTCFDAPTNPLIYDYGGRPVVTTAGAFDFFKNTGPTKALGTDCSGYVYMALATAGLKMKSATTLKASTIFGVSSHLFVDPAKNGIDCLVHAKFTGADTLRAGDIVAKPGHVFIIEKVGADPFGLATLTNVSQCKLENMSSDRFDFTILQSSPSKTGLGIHRAVIKDYAPEAPQIQVTLLDMAVHACKAKFAPTTTTTVRSTQGSIVRHSGTAACKATALKMERESCVASCPL